jgi:protein-tyrosine phosphatase
MSTKVLFVCLGNICRSPLAEAVFLDKVRKRGLSDFISADSCGTASYHVGSAPDHRSQAVAKAHDVPMSHTGKWLKDLPISEFDYVLAMDSANAKNIKTVLNGKTKPQLFKMRAFDPIGTGGDVPDPYYGEMSGFEEVYQILDRSCEQFLDFLFNQRENATT